MTNEDRNRFRDGCKVAFVITTLVILVDFVLPGKTVDAEILSVKRGRQQYYNAAGNHHYSYQIITDIHQFTVEEDFAKEEKGQENIEFSVSRIFREVNRYGLEASDSKGISSLRIFSGLVLPLLTLISMGIVHWYKKKMDVLIFVLQALLLADLIYLLL